MGYGPVINGKQRPITPWMGSWAQQEQARREGKPAPPLPQRPADGQWPLGHSPYALRLTGRYDSKGRPL
jgi:hypothetical protein